MVKPEGIPDRIMIEAEAVNDAIFRIAHDEVHILGHTDRKTAIARAILAAEQGEREACAQVCDAEEKMRTNWMETRDADWPEMKERQRVGAQQSRLLAAAIRNRGEHHD